MANADRCACCGAIIPEGSQVCPNCKVAVKPDDDMDAYAYLAKYMEDKKQKKPKPKKKDLVEVVHGRWEDMWDGKYANPRYRCSVCKEKANYKPVQDELLTWHDVQALTPYCPYCMAKLDGGIDNDI